MEYVPFGCISLGNCPRSRLACRYILSLTQTSMDRVHGSGSPPYDGSCDSVNRLSLLNKSLLGLAYWEQKPRDSNDRSVVGPSTHWPTYHKNRSNFLNRHATHNPSRAFFVSTVRVSYLNGFEDLYSRLVAGRGIEDSLATLKSPTGSPVVLRTCTAGSSLAVVSRTASLLSSHQPEVQWF